MQRHPETGLPLPSTPFSFIFTLTTDANSYSEVIIFSNSSVNCNKYFKYFHHNLFFLFKL
jgi:hypothetical protein